MKCQHCGINFDDSESECPICGARAGSRGRLTQSTSIVRAGSQRVKSTYSKHTVVNKNAKKTHTIIDTRVKVAVVFIVAVVLIQIVPVFVGGISDLIFNATHIAPERVHSETAVWLHELTGPHVSGQLENGAVLSLETDENDNYELMVDGDWKYSETGYAWISPWNVETDGKYPDSEYFPMDKYGCYVICLDANSMEQSGKTRDISEHEDAGEMWILIYVDYETGKMILSDRMGEGEFLFGDGVFLPIQQVETEIYI